MAKPASLDAGLVVKKGAAAVTDGAPQRGTPVPAPASVKASSGEALVPLNFRVPASFREEFESYAFNSQPRRKMVALLKDAFAALKEKEGR